MERVGLPKVAVIAVWAGAPPAPSWFRGDPGLDSLPTCPSWYEHYERVLMTGISGRLSELALVRMHGRAGDYLLANYLKPVR